jgi:regulator of protease activity HflC (stomatin/prohibitin superfamily)
VGATDGKGGITMSTAMGAAKDIHQEQPVRTYSGFVALAIGIALLVLAGWLVNDIFANVRARVPISFAMLAATVVVAITAVLVLLGLYTLQPNEAAIIQLFGAYRGTTRTPGLRATNPFYTRKKLSLRARNLNGERLKVNDKRGNPIEIAAVVVWRVDDTAKAFFDVDSYENYVKLQAEAAVRHLASSFAYDDADRTMPDTAEPTLLASATTVTRALVTELEERFEKAGVIVEEARITHLAYAPEIAQVMLRRQQAEAIIAARTKIVHGAVSMVQMALNELSERRVVELDDERRAAMVSNLLTVLCAESEVQPVINTGTLYA